MDWKNRLVSKIQMLIAKITGGVAQDESAPIIGGKVTEGMPELLRKAASEGIVMLKNDNMLPLGKERQISLFGRVQIDYFYTGYGSGGDVRKPYAVNLLDGIKNCEDLSLNLELADIYTKWVEKNEAYHGFWAHWPRSLPEMMVSKDLAKRASENSKDAVIVIGRSSGEDRENVLDRGSYYLTKDEEKIIKNVTSAFENVCIVLNIGSVIDLSWIEEYENIKAVLISWQGGMESGNAIADVLSGKVSPSGKLADTFIYNFKDHPTYKDFGAAVYNNYVEDVYVGYRYFETFKKDAVQFPFGYGLSYTKFKQELVKTDVSEKDITLSIKVQNIGDYKGKDVIQVYVQKPNYPIDNPYRELIAYEKTSELDKGEEETIDIKIKIEDLSIYDTKGVLGFKSSFVVSIGDYIFSIGEDIRQAKDVFRYTQRETLLVHQVSEVMAPVSNFKIMKNNDGKIEWVNVDTRTTDLKSIILNNLPKDIPQTEDKGYKLVDVKENRVSMDDFVAQLSLDELEAISRGDYTMNSPLGAAGNAGAIGGVLPSLREKGIPAAITTDGPSGIRLTAGCSLIPIGTLLACTFNKALVQEVYTKVAEEMKDRGSDILLAPGMNIHRTPLCGRNFEYYSEDPYLTGTMASASIKGIQAYGGSACPKHFACNNQEFKRTTTDARLSERALREVYLKGFEICIKDAKPKTIMTSYNKINGVWNHYNYELCNTVLRGEWNFDGLVMTDWWMQYAPSPEFSCVQSNGYRVRSRVDVLMPGGKRIGKNVPDGTLLESYGKEEGITLGEMQQVAKDVLGYMLLTNKL